jgi:hypothetical protein
MVAHQRLALLLLLPTLLGGCAVTRVLQGPDPMDPALQTMHEQHLEIHQWHHQIAVEAHEAATRLHEQMASPPPPPPPESLP